MARTLDRKLVNAIKQDILKARKSLKEQDSALTAEERDEHIRMTLIDDIDGVCGVVPCPIDHVDQAFKELNQGFQMPVWGWAALGVAGVSAALLAINSAVPIAGLGAIKKGKWQPCSARMKKGCIAEAPTARWDSMRKRYRLRWPNGDITYETKGAWTKLKRQLQTQRNRIIRRRMSR